MIAWAAWTLVASTLVALSAELLSRSAWYVSTPRRFVWLGAVLGAVAMPLALPARVWTPAFTTRAAVHSAIAQKLNQSPPSAPHDTGGAETGIADKYFKTLIAVTNRWFVAVWSLWSLALVIALVRAVVGLKRLTALCTDADTEFGPVLVAGDIGPAVVGWIRPRIVVPSWVMSIEPQMQMLVLRHEAEHVRAGDTRLLLVAEVVRRLVPWNIALWWMVNRLRLAIELDCDARVIRAVGASHPYGVMLLTVSERINHQPSLAMSPLASRHDLERRLDTLAAKRRRRPMLSAFAYSSVAAILLATVAWTPRPGFPTTSVTSIARVDSALVRVGYEKRKATGRGFFLDGAGVDRHTGLFSDAFRAVPGLRVSPSGDGRTNVIASGNDARECVQTFIDGRRWETTSPGDIDNFVSATQIIAIEVYRARDVPNQFAQDNTRDCLSLIVWTHAIDQSLR